MNLRHQKIKKMFNAVKNEKDNFARTNQQKQKLLLLSNDTNREGSSCTKSHLDSGKTTHFFHSIFFDKIYYRQPLNRQFLYTVTVCLV